MSLLAGLLAIAVLITAVPGPALAGAFDPTTGEQQDVMGMIVFKIPFGVSRRRKPAPEIGFDLNIADPRLRDYEPRRFEPKSGRWLPRHDIERVQTWPLKSTKVRSNAPAESHR